MAPKNKKAVGVKKTIEKKEKTAAAKAAPKEKAAAAAEEVVQVPKGGVLIEVGTVTHSKFFFSSHNSLKDASSTV